MDRPYRKQFQANIITFNPRHLKIELFSSAGCCLVVVFHGIASGRALKIEFSSQQNPIHRCPPARRPPLEPRDAAVAKIRSVYISNGNERSPSRCETQCRANEDLSHQDGEQVHIQLQTLLMNNQLHARQCLTCSCRSQYEGMCTGTLVMSASFLTFFPSCVEIQPKGKAKQRRKIYQDPQLL